MIKKTIKVLALITLFAGTALTAQTASAWWGGGPWNWFDDGPGWGGPWGGYPGWGGYRYPYYGGYPGWGGYGYPYGGYGYPGWGGYGYPYGGYPVYTPPAAPAAPATDSK